VARTSGVTPFSGGRMLLATPLIASIAGFRLVV
jgi:hypothetical protein